MSATGGLQPLHKQNCNVAGLPRQHVVISIDSVPVCWLLEEHASLSDVELSL